MGTPGSARTPLPMALCLPSSYLSKSRRPHAAGPGSRVRNHMLPVSPCPGVGLGRSQARLGSWAVQRVHGCRPWSPGHREYPHQLKATLPDGTLPARTRVTQGGGMGTGSFQLGTVPAAPLKSDSNELLSPLTPKKEKQLKTGKGFRWAPAGSRGQQIHSEAAAEAAEKISLLSSWK